MDEKLVIRVKDALRDGVLSTEDLTARRLAPFLGRSTSVFYHGWGSLDGFLYKVGQAAILDLGASLLATLMGGDLADMAEAFVVFGLEHESLYTLMFERRYDWEALRKTGAIAQTLPGLHMWDALLDLLAAGGARQPADDARILYAGLHGLILLASSGRANFRAMETSDKDMARHLARQLALRLCPALDDQTKPQNPSPERDS